MLHRDITVAVDIDAYGLEHLHYNCKVAVGEINATIKDLQASLNPFDPAKLLQASDLLYYQLIDHTTDQEITMLREGFLDYPDQQSLHSKMVDLVASVDHRQIFDDADKATDYVSQLTNLSESHLEEEAEFSRFLEAQRFRR